MNTDLRELSKQYILTELTETEKQDFFLYVDTLFNNNINPKLNILQEHTNIRDYFKEVKQGYKIHWKEVCIAIHIIETECLMVTKFKKVTPKCIFDFDKKNNHTQCPFYSICCEYKKTWDESHIDEVDLKYNLIHPSLVIENTKKNNRTRYIKVQDDLNNGDKVCNNPFCLITNSKRICEMYDENKATDFNILHKDIEYRNTIYKIVRWIMEGKKQYGDTYRDIQYLELTKKLNNITSNITTMDEPEFREYCKQNKLYNLGRTTISADESKYSHNIKLWNLIDIIKEDIHYYKLINNNEVVVDDRNNLILDFTNKINKKITVMFNVLLSEHKYTIKLPAIVKEYIYDNSKLFITQNTNKIDIIDESGEVKYLEEDEKIENEFLEILWQYKNKK